MVRRLLFSGWTRGVVIIGLAMLSVVVWQPPASAGTLAQKFRSVTVGSKVTVDHDAWDRLLATYLRPGSDGLTRVDYRSWKAHGRPGLEGYLGSLRQVDIAGLERAEQAAFWINLYNAETVLLVLDAYPLQSIKDIDLGGSLLSAFTGGPWTKKVVRVGGVDLSLDDIEHEILRPLFKDPRLHYAVNCASIGCPNLAGKAYRGASLEAQLDAGARAYVNSGRGLSIAGGRLVASRIYQWFAEDFGGSEPAVIAHLRRYAQGDTAKALTDGARIAGYAYDWNLNDASP